MVVIFSQGKCPGRIAHHGRLIPTKDYKSLQPVVMNCVTLVNTHTHRYSIWTTILKHQSAELKTGPLNPWW